MSSNDTHVFISAININGDFKQGQTFYCFRSVAYSNVQMYLEANPAERPVLFTLVVEEPSAGKILQGLTFLPANFSSLSSSSNEMKILILGGIA